MKWIEPVIVPEPEFVSVNVVSLTCPEWSAPTKISQVPGVPITSPIYYNCDARGRDPGRTAGDASGHERSSCGTTGGQRRGRRVPAGLARLGRRVDRARTRPWALRTTVITVGDDGVTTVPPLPLEWGHPLAGRIVVPDGRPLPPGTHMWLGRSLAWDGSLVPLNAHEAPAGRPRP
jgi:hypothetical protein